MNSYYGVIMAGGGGTRFWPRSRQETPKQLLPLVSEVSLIQETQSRLADSVSPEQTLIITNTKQVSGTRIEVPALPAANIIAEPVGRNTAPCVGLAAVIAQVMSKGDPVIGVFPADHSISPVKELSRSIETAVALAANGEGIALIGIRPSHPATGYGYIHTGAVIEGTDVPSFQVSEFKEKPDVATAEAFVKDGAYLWNAGMFFVRASTVLSELKRQQPEIYHLLEILRPSIGTESQDTAIAEAYNAMPSISFDYAVMEGAQSVQVVEASFTWDDVGSWSAVERHFPADENNNVVRGDSVLIDAKNNTVDSKRLVALLGVDNLIVVETDDAIMVCHKDRSEDVKLIVEKLKAQGRDDFL